MSNGAASDKYGWALASAGDVNLDGTDDLLIGSQGGYVDVRSGADHSLLLTVSGAVGDKFGRAVASAGDIDGDGRPDLLVGAQNAGVLDEGAVHVISGADGSELLVLAPGAAGNLVGSASASIGDVDADGVPDIVVGGYLAAPAGNASGSAWVLSGADGSELARVDGVIGEEKLGRDVAAAGDVDQDGLPDWVVGIPGSGCCGRIEVRSGLDASTIRAMNGISTSSQMGNQVDGGKDLDGDGVPEFAGAADSDDSASLNGGRVAVYSGANSQLLLEVTGAANEKLGRVELLSDFDGDGRADVCVSSFNSNPGGVSQAGSASVYSGRTGGLLASYEGSAIKDHLGIAAALGDTDGDGLSDLVVSARDEDVGTGADHGRVYVYPGQSVPFSIDAASVSLMDGGVRSFVINEESVQAGVPYLILGSHSGTDPVLQWDIDKYIPLALDAYFMHTLMNANTPPLQNSFGYLDANGVALASFTVPSFSNPAFVGIEVHHAYLLLGEAGAIAASPAIGLSLAP